MSYSYEIKVDPELGGKPVSVSGVARQADLSTVELAPSERATVVIAKPLVADGSPDRSVVVIACPTGGLLAHIAPQATDADVIDPCYLLTGGEDVLSQVQDGTADPVFTAGGSWVNHEAGSGALYDTLRFEALLHADDPQQIHHGGTYWRQNLAGAVALESRYVWGRDNYVNLGAVDDGLAFTFWVKADESLTSLELRFYSYPYTSARVEDPDETDGDTDDLVYATEAAPAAYFSVDCLPQFADDGNWNRIRVDKSAFSATLTPEWSRITEVAIMSTSDTAGYSVYGSSIEFGPGDLGGYVNGAAIYPLRATDRTSLVVNLKAPSDNSCKVLVGWVVE